MVPNLLRVCNIFSYWIIKTNLGDDTSLCQGTSVTYTSIVLVRFHPGKFCYCSYYWQHFSPLHVIEVSRYSVTLTRNKTINVQETRLSPHHPFLCLMSSNDGHSWHQFFSLLFGFEIISNMAKHVLTDGKVSFVGVSLTKQRLIPISDWIEQWTEAVSVFA